MALRLHALAAAAALLTAAAPVAAAPSQTRAAIERAADAVKPLVGTDPAKALPKLAELRQRVARLDDRRGRELAGAAIARLEAESYLRLARPDRAAPIIERAVAATRALDPNSRLLGDLLLTRGGLLVDRAEVADALADFHQAYELYRRNGDPRAQASTLMSIFYLYFEAKDYTSAIKYAEQARQLYRGDDPLLLLSIHNNRALSLIQLGRYRAAEAQSVEGLAVARSMKSPMLEAQVLRNLTRARLLAGKLAEARGTLADARRITPAGSDADARATDALEAQIALEMKRPDEAERLIARSFAGVDLSTTQLSSREAHETAYRIYAARHDDARALAHLAALKRLDDEATKLATTTSTALMGARFDFANQELKIANLQRDEARRSVAFERARANSQRTLFLGGAGAVMAIIVLLLVGLFTIRRSRDRVRAAAAELRVSNDQLGKALAARTEFLATTSHEIRTPLNGILGMTQVILTDRGLEPSLRDRLQLVHAAGTTMRALVDDILDVAKMESGNLTIEDAPFDPRATLADVALLWKDQARARGLEFTVDLDACPATMMGDAARVRQVAFNLLSNAVKFTREGGVTIRAAGGGEALTIAVADTGIGIPVGKQEEIFESFRQADAGTTREFGGTGLGLSICRRLADAMGGRIAVVSTPGRGSAFTVTLPLRVPEMAAPESDAAGGAPALLVIERNPIARAMLRTLFVPHGEVVIVPSAEDALAWFGGNEAFAILAGASTIDADAQGRIGTAAHGLPRFLLCDNAMAADGRAIHGWRTLARPISGAALVDEILAASVISSSDTLARQAA